jgi:4-aminobutyrate aminotransferase/(S)-3-amino-2-methylpropionate transaminase
MKRGESEILVSRLAAVESPGVTTFGENRPIFWKSAAGSIVTDVDNHQFIDMSAAFGVMNVGYSNPAVTAAVTEQAATLIHGMGDVHPPAVKVELLEALSSITPDGLNLALLSLNGSDAVESALKCSALVTGRPGIIAFDGAYHGLGGGSLHVTSGADFREPFLGQMGDFAHFVDFPTDAALVPAVLAQIEDLANQGTIGGLIIEPIQGRGGIRVPPSGFLAALRELCFRQDLLLIFDEIFTGLGRTGSWFAADYEEVTPDLLCVGKALGGGMPLSAVVGGENSLGQWPEAQGFALHTSTFLGHPVCCAAGLAAIRETRGRELPARAGELGRHVINRLKDAPVVEMRGRGLMIGLELETGKRTQAVVQKALEQGVILLPCGTDGRVVSLTPPLVIGVDELDRALDVLLRCLNTTPA